MISDILASINCINIWEQRFVVHYHHITLSECDYTPSFMKKGKVNPFKLLQKNEAVQDVLIALGEINSLEQDDTEFLEKHVCQLYGQKIFLDITDVRMHLPFQKNQQKEDTERLSLVKLYDGGLLPPCKRVHYSERR